MEEASNYKRIIDTFLKASRQRINMENFVIFFLNTHPSMKYSIFNLMGYKKGYFPYKYLGIQIDKHTKDGKIWEPILEKLDKKIDN